MNVTPLVDVVLVLLIIFMVIAPALSQQLWLTIPDEPDDVPAEALDPKKPLVISVTGKGELRINKDVVPDEELPPKLKRVLAARGDRKVFFDAQDAVDFERAAEALDLVKAGGGTTIAVMTEPLKE
jgi:biopolymer transport protein ExbD